MTPTSLLGIIGSVFGLLSLVAGAAVYLRASYAKARIDALNAEIEEEKRRRGSLQEDLVHANAKIDVLEAKVAALNELVTQRAQLDGLRDTINELRKQIEAITHTVGRVLERVTPP